LSSYMTMEYEYGMDMFRECNIKCVS